MHTKQTYSRCVFFLHSFFEEKFMELIMYIMGYEKKITKSQWFGQKFNRLPCIEEQYNGGEGDNHMYRFVRSDDSGFDNVLQDITGTFHCSVFS